MNSVQYTKPRNSACSSPKDRRNRPSRSWFVTRHCDICKAATLSGNTNEKRLPRTTHSCTFEAWSVFHVRFHDAQQGNAHMNSNGESRNSGRAPFISVQVARIAAAGLISVSSLALAWATSRNVGSKTEIDTNPAQPRSLHAKPPSGTKRHRSSAGHHPGKQSGKPQGHGQQGAQNGVSQGRNSTG